MRDNERLLTIIGEVDEQLIWEAEHLKPEAPKPVWFRQPWLRAAAALVLVIAIGLSVRGIFPERTKDSYQTADADRGESSSETAGTTEEPVEEEAAEAGMEEAAEEEAPAEEEAVEEDVEEAAPEEEESYATEEAAEAEKSEDKANGAFAETPDEILRLEEEGDTVRLILAEEDVKILKAEWLNEQTGAWENLTLQEGTFARTEAGWIRVTIRHNNGEQEEYYKYLR